VGIWPAFSMTTGYFYQPGFSWDEVAVIWISSHTVLPIEARMFRPYGEIRTYGGRETTGACPRHIINRRTLNDLIGKVGAILPSPVISTASTYISLSLLDSPRKQSNPESDGYAFRGGLPLQRDEDIASSRCNLRLSSDGRDGPSEYMARFFV
jgi:hypothetical protein